MRFIWFAFFNGVGATLPVSFGLIIGCLVGCSTKAQEESTNKDRFERAKVSEEQQRFLNYKRSKELVARKDWESLIKHLPPYQEECFGTSHAWPALVEIGAPESIVHLKAIESFGLNLSGDFWFDLEETIHKLEHGGIETEERLKRLQDEKTARDSMIADLTAKGDWERLVELLPPRGRLQGSEEVVIGLRKIGDSRAVPYLQGVRYSPCAEGYGFSGWYWYIVNQTIDELSETRLEVEE